MVKSLLADTAINRSYLSAQRLFALWAHYRHVAEEVPGKQLFFLPRSAVTRFHMNPTSLTNDGNISKYLNALKALAPSSPDSSLHLFRGSLPFYFLRPPDLARILFGSVVVQDNQQLLFDVVARIVKSFTAHADPLMCPIITFKALLPYRSQVPFSLARIRL
ncbi:hypothetical protein A0J61_05049 [Choanephora cucurbitarum]|uniref:Uncharacterized protein n=1 Tax=Choanephora cucurbitarum TaxID=101091 RepID=A0A1C7NCP6_9FUNG|nr:hypothetical protein A0J61_05049 [Choanephora cucurbitarum]